jgi:lipopolysaccharide export system permease protein
MNKIINKYLINGFLKSVVNTMLVFICLGILLNLFEEIEFFKNIDEGLGLPFLLTLMFIPNLMIKLLPFIVFIASMWFLISIKTNKDLLSLKVFGYSNLKIISILTFTAFVLGILIIAAINPITSIMIKYYESTKAQYSRDIDHLVSINKNGVWIKEMTNNKLRITTAKNLEKNNLIDVTIYNLSINNSNIDSRIQSKEVDISDNIWVLYNAKTYTFDNNEVRFETTDVLQINSKYNIDKLNSLYKNLDTISFFELVKNYNLLENQGYPKEILNEKLNIFFSLPVFLALMVVLASIFTVGSINKAQNIYYIFISIISCVVIYYFKDLSIALGQTNRITLTLAVWMPIIAISLFCTIGVLQINEK